MKQRENRDLVSVVDNDAAFRESTLTTTYQSAESIEDLRLEIAAREKPESALQALNDELLTRFGVITKELEKEIAERKQAEKELQRSEAYLAEAQKLSHTG